MILCKSVLDIWNGVYKWWGFNIPPNARINNMFAGEGGNGLSGLDKSIWQAVEWVTGYQIWKNRNLKVFHKDSWATAKMVNEIQVKTYEWINNRSKTITLDWHKWMLDPKNSGHNCTLQFDPG
ncbi:uncharacterized protein [Rutidosis leptorrhynchoides]|uniref:uncharacterized protein n=1 Tax=Rutidosis leptorrhynchoides TaxID=125765 RepID=UPI003A9928C2